MKHNRILRIVTSLIGLFLLMLIVPVAPVLAQDGYIYVSPSRGEVGDEIDIWGVGFDPSDYVYIFFSSYEADEGDDMEDLDAYEYLGGASTGSLGSSDEGEFEKSVDVPDELTDGDEDEIVRFGIYYIYVSYDRYGDDIVDSVEFSITGIESDPTQGNVGSEVEITGAGFGSRDDIEVFYDGDEIGIESGDTETDGDGEFTSAIIIPVSTAGKHDIQVEVNGDEAEVEFTVLPAVTFTPTSGNVGDAVTVSGTGFGGNKDLTIYYNNSPVTSTGGTSKSDSNGSFDNLRFEVPPQGAGTYDIRVRDSANNSATAKTRFTIAGTIDMSPTSGNVGTRITASGTGFVPGSTVSIKYDDKEIATTTVQSDGAFSTEFAAPASKGGNHTVTISGTITKQFTFTMESTPPPVPGPLEPAEGTKTEAQVHFDWRDVTDPSLPVTYVLQVAADEDFSSILLQKKGLSDSEYTLTEDEQLPSVKKEAPYYWRVKAIDSAGNESEWSTPRPFYVGFAFELTGWVLYTFMAIGGLILLLIGFLLGRRIAFSRPARPGLTP